MFLGKRILSRKLFTANLHLGLGQCLGNYCGPCIAWCKNFAAYKIVVNIICTKLYSALTVRELDITQHGWDCCKELGEFHSAWRVITLTSHSFDWTSRCKSTACVFSAAS